jgi:hypothetical protein
VWYAYHLREICARLEVAVETRTFGRLRDTLLVWNRTLHGQSRVGWCGCLVRLLEPFEFVLEQA